MLDDLKALVRDVEKLDGPFRYGEDGVLDREGSLLRSWEHASEDAVTQYFLASLLVIDLGDVHQEVIVHTLVPAAGRLPALHYVRLPAFDVDVNGLDAFSVHLKAWLGVQEWQARSARFKEQVA